MKKFNILTKTLIVVLAISFGSCKKTLDSITANPNSVTPSSADVDLYLSQVQLSFKDFYNNVSDDGATLSRQQYWAGPLYRNNFSPPDFDFMWTTAYSSIINNANAMIPLAEAQNKFVQAGIAKVLKAYTLGTLVDVFNDVPFTQAEMGLSNVNPAVDPAASIYTAVQALLDDAIKDFAKPGASAITSDLFYGSANATNWTTVAKTMKLKFFMQTRLVDPAAAASIKTLLAENNLINTAAQDFVFRYGSNNNTPDSRHPHYANSYQATGGAGEYLSNYFMWEVASQKYGGNVNLTGDPRLRYYFYRETDNYAWANVSTCPCYPNSQFGNSNFPPWYPAVPTVTPYCVIGKGYLGRDHGDNSGAPPDGTYRTAYGVYPVGGDFDSNQPAAAASGVVAVTLTSGGKGAGINPIWLSSYTAFLKAEAALKLGLVEAGDPRAMLSTGVNASITKVMAFPATVNLTPAAASVPTAAQVTSYVNLVLANYDAAATSDAKLNVVMTEYHIAAFGNGIEAYNNLRRTGMPFNLQPAVAVANPGFFMRSFYYPSVYINRNLSHAPQKTPGDAVNKVFWDNNPDNFIK